MAFLRDHCAKYLVFLLFCVDFVVFYEGKIPALEFIG